MKTYTLWGIYRSAGCTNILKSKYECVVLHYLLANTGCHGSDASESNKVQNCQRLQLPVLCSTFPARLSFVTKYAIYKSTLITLASKNRSLGTCVHETAFMTGAAAWCVAMPVMMHSAHL